jgi:hypothetical protein
MRRLEGSPTTFARPLRHPGKHGSFRVANPKPNTESGYRCAGPADLIYAIIANYRDGHGHVLPRPPFGALQVEQGGIGDGTVINCQIRIFGRTQTFRAVVTEPELGRVLVETNPDNGWITTFTVDPVAARSRVTIATDFESRDDLLGRLQAFLIARFLRPVYERQLDALEKFAAIRAGQRQSLS